MEHREPLQLLESENIYVKAPTVVKEKTVIAKRTNEKRRKTKRLEAEKIEEAEGKDFPPLLLDNFKTKAVLAKVFILLVCLLIVKKTSDHSNLRKC